MLTLATLASLGVSLLPQAASAIGTMLAGPRGGAAAGQFAEAVQTMAGTTDVEEARRVIAEHPEMADRLRVQLENIMADHALALAREENEARRIAAADTLNAREMALATTRAGGSNRMRDVVAVANMLIFAVACVGCVYAVMLNNDPVVISITGTIIGATSWGMQATVSYFLGSSAGSATKEAHLIRQNGGKQT